MTKEPLYPHRTPSQIKAEGGASQPPGAFKVSTVVEVSEERIKDLLTNALEGGSNYWYIIKKYNYPPGQTKESLGIEFEHIEVPFQGGSILMGESEGDPEYDKVLDRAAIDRGLQLMAEKYPKHWADFIVENDDATTGDVFLQLALFGEVVFG